MSSADAIIAGIVVLYLVFAWQRHREEVDYVESAVDHRRYVVRNLPDKQKAADMLGNLNKVLQQLIAHVVGKYPQDEDYRRLEANYNPSSISEGTEETNYTSYSVNKGEKIVFCLRSRKDNTLVDTNTLAYVAIHELGHLMTDEVGHTPLFWKNFQRLLKEAVEIGLYKSIDYGKEPQEYCGVVIQSNVLNR